MTAPIRYTLLQIPGWLFLGCLLWWAVSSGWVQFATANWIMFAWVLKDAAVYPLYRYAFNAVPIIGPEALLGRRADVVVALTPVGRVNLDGETWQARARDHKSISAGQRVRINAMDGLTLIVESSA